MNILVTGSKGFIGKNLVATLKNIRDLKIKQDQILKLKMYLNMILIQLLSL